MKRFKKILVANRGEIAIRVMRAARELGIKTVAIFSDCDRTSLHVRYADEAYPLGGNLPSETYINMEKILNIAKKCGADAIHPGYGFLAENDEFARECEERGIKFIGPSPETMKKMGDKVEARKTAERANVPIIPGTKEAVNDVKEAIKVAREIGYPVMLKAKAGGGGKGMRLVKSDDEMESAFRLASSEAKSAFGDPSLYIEKALLNPKHIEVQIIGDEYGNIIHLFERDCSIQRRHQKIVEESPSPNITDEMRNKIIASAVKVAKEAGYTNAGTVEFLVDGENYYFLEVNARLQVEHPITERLTGVDIVKLQIKVAEGNKLELSQDDVKRAGHAFEFRIYAEDPFNNFVPSPGKVKKIFLPGGFGVRVDTGIYEGFEVPIYYDPILMKVIVWDKTRELAIEKAKRSLKELNIIGIRTNLPFHLWLLTQEEFIKGNYSTKFVDEKFRGISEEKWKTEGSIIAGCIMYLEERERILPQRKEESKVSMWVLAGRMENARRS